MDTLFFSTPAEFYEWLNENHASVTELWVGYYKKATGIPSMTWPDSVDQALCFGWIDGIRKSIDDKSYKIRFTPRRPKSIWSAVNIKKVEALTKAGLMMPAGLAAYDKKTAELSKIYSYERANIQLAPAYLAELKANQQAWDFFEKLAPSYKKNSIFWVMRAKREETRLRRLAILIQSCDEGMKIPLLRSKKK